MILPALNVCGEVVTEPWRDARTPRPFVGHDPATAVDRHRRTEQCPDGRHLWDLLQTSGAYRDRDGDDDVAGELDVRFTGTCVRCGVIWRFEGTELDRNIGGADRVTPVPLRAGELRAQEVDRAAFTVAEDRARSTFTVHVGEDPAPVGCIGWARSRRGRYYYRGRLDAWPADEMVEAPSAIGCLRKLARGGEPR